MSAGFDNFFCVRRNCEVNEKLPLRGSHFAWKGLARAFHVGCATLSVDRLFCKCAKGKWTLSSGSDLKNCHLKETFFAAAATRLVLHNAMLLSWMHFFASHTRVRWTPKAETWLNRFQQEYKNFLAGFESQFAEKSSLISELFGRRLFHWEASTARVVVVQHDARWRCLRAALTFNPARTAAEKNSQTT